MFINQSDNRALAFFSFFGHLKIKKSIGYKPPNKTEVYYTLHNNNKCIGLENIIRTLCFVANIRRGCKVFFTNRSACVSSTDSQFLLSSTTCQPSALINACEAAGLWMALALALASFRFSCFHFDNFFELCMFWVMALYECCVVVPTRLWLIWLTLRNF